MKRTKIDIIYTILSIIEENPGIKPTRLMSKANLSYEALQIYLKEIVATGFLELKQQKNYVLTEKGRIFLKEYRQFSAFLQAFGL